MSNSRRDFLRRSALAGGAAALAGPSALAGPAPRAADAPRRFQTIESTGYAARDASGRLSPWTFERRALRPNDVLVDIQYSGVCHSDIHQLRGDWGPQPYPQVPGHEIAGVVAAVGGGVTRFEVGDRVGVGTMVGCRGGACKHGEEQYSPGVLFTYGTPDDRSPTGITQGGYANNVIVEESFAIKIPETIRLEHAAPLLCAGITTYTPLLDHAVRRGDRVGVVGIGGLGHLAVKLALSKGAHVTAFTTTPDKAGDIRGWGATPVVVGSTEDLRAHYNTQDYVVSTVPFVYDVDAYVPLVRAGGTYTQVGIGAEPLSFGPMTLIFNRVTYEGSLTGGIPQTQALVDYCAENGVFPEVEVIRADEVNDAWESVVEKEARYRYVIDVSTI